MHHEENKRMKTKTLLARATALLLAVLISTTAFGQAKQTKKGTSAAKNPIVDMETSMGTIAIEVFSDKAPVTAKNFLDYVEMGFHNNTIIHRVEPGFVIQGGGYLANFQARPTKPGIKNESKNGLKNSRGTLSMARYDDPNSATSQFFINLAENTSLDASAGQWGYAVFARVIGGMDVVDKIAAVKTSTSNPLGMAAPVQPIIVKSAKVRQ
jgi:peptidyl-prolyl cis-trans isomerase A (cyclophilin A)